MSHRLFTTVWVGNTKPITYVSDDGADFIKLTFNVIIFGKVKYLKGRSINITFY